MDKVTCATVGTRFDTCTCVTCVVRSVVTWTAAVWRTSSDTVGCSRVDGFPDETIDTRQCPTTSTSTSTITTGACGTSRGSTHSTRADHSAHTATIPATYTIRSTERVAACGVAACPGYDFVRGCAVYDNTLTSTGAGTCAAVISVRVEIIAVAVVIVLVESRNDALLETAAFREWILRDGYCRGRGRGSGRR